MAEATNFKNNKTGQQIDLVDQDARDQIEELNETLTQLTKTAEAVNLLLPGSNELLYDDQNKPSVMVKIPKFKISDVIEGGADEVHPAFIVNGHTLDYIYISKYQNIVENGRAYSKPGVAPEVSISWNNAKSYSEAKGSGWHLMTRVEYAAIALWCKKNGFLPYGNNDYGKDTREDSYKAIPAEISSTSGRTLRVLTGSGPLTWSHDGEPDGIWDLNGNVAERTAAFRLVNGELQFLPDNDGADSANDQGASSECWKALDATTGQFVTPDGSGTTANTVKLSAGTYYYDIEATISDSDISAGGFYKASCSDDISDAAKAVLRTYALLPEEGATAADYDNDGLIMNNSGSYIITTSGGGRSHGTGAGVFCVFNGGYRTGTATDIGFRSAYAPLSTD